MPQPRLALVPLAIALALAGVGLPAAAATGVAPAYRASAPPLPAIAPTAPAVAAPQRVPGAVPRGGPSPAPAVPEAKSPVVRIGTSTVLTVRGPASGLTARQRAGVIQSRIDTVLLNHPYLTAKAIKVLAVGQAPTIYIGQFPIVSVDLASARANTFSSPEVLAHAWANNLRRAMRGYFSDKRLPERALYHTPKGSDFTYRRTPETLANPAALRNTRYTFSPDDFEYGAGVKAAGQAGFVIFAPKDAPDPPGEVFLGNPEGTFTRYVLVKPEDEQP